MVVGRLVSRVGLIVALLSCCCPLGAREAPFFEETALFVGGEGGYQVYRIPSLIVAPDGTVLAFCEARKNGPSDHGDIDLVMRRSPDQGQSWSEMEVLLDDGENTMGNPCPVVDQSTGSVYLLFCRNNDTVHVMHSEDNGVTWSETTDITADVKPKEWDTWYATGPGHGIQLSTGRLLIPCDHRENKTKHSHVIYSDDHGMSWKLGGTLAPDTDECVAVEVEDGSVYLNMRSYRGRNRRAVAWSSDGGVTWSEVEDDDTLVEPVCQASLIRLSDNKSHRKNRVLFSNPNSTKRENLSIRISYDECRTWTEGKVVHAGPSAYSDLAVTADGTILCLYERGHDKYHETITLARFDLEWLTDGADKLKPREQPN